MFVWPSFGLHSCSFIPACSAGATLVGVRGGSSLMVRGEDVAEPYLVVLQCDRLKKWWLYMRKKNNKNYIVMYLWIPMILWYGYMVCHGVLKLTTIPIPTKPMTPNPWVFLYLSQSLVGTWLGAGVPNWEASVPILFEMIASGSRAWHRRSLSPRNIVSYFGLTLTEGFPPIYISWCCNSCISHRINNIPSHLSDSTRPIHVNTDQQHVSQFAA